MSSNIMNVFKSLASKDNTFGETLAEKVPGAEPLMKPPVSEAQRRYMGAVSQGDVPGVSPSVGKEFLSEDKGGKLPERVAKNVDTGDFLGEELEKCSNSRIEKIRKSLKPHEAKEDKERKEGNGTDGPTVVNEGPLNEKRLKALLAQEKHEIKELSSHFSPDCAKAAYEAGEEANQHEEQADEGEGAVYNREDLSKKPKGRYDELMERVKKCKYATNDTDPTTPPKKLEKALPVLKEPNNMVGGKADNIPLRKLDNQQLAAGTKVEEEHTKDPSIAKEIASDHLAEIPDYYSRLNNMEEEAKGGNIGKLIHLFKKGSMLNKAADTPKEDTVIREGKDNSKVVGKVKLDGNGKWHWAKDGEEADFSVRKQHGYYRITSGKYRGRYLHSVVAEQQLGRKLKDGEEVDHVDGNRSSTKHLKVMSIGDHAGKTDKTRGSNGSGPKRYEHSKDNESRPETVKKSTKPVFLTD